MSCVSAETCAGLVITALNRDICIAVDVFDGGIIRTDADRDDTSDIVTFCIKEVVDAATVIELLEDATEAIWFTELIASMKDELYAV